MRPTSVSFQVFPILGDHIHFKVTTARLQNPQDRGRPPSEVTRPTVCGLKEISQNSMKGRANALLTFDGQSIYLFDSLVPTRKALEIQSTARCWDLTLRRDA